MEVKTQHLNKLNTRFHKLDLEERLRQFYFEFYSKKILCSSSFGAHSVILLYLISKINPKQPIYFIDTGNHFQETLEYRDLITKELNIKVKTITASSEVHNYSNLNELWKSNPEYCCHLKKVKPVNELKKENDIWISGLMEWQSDHRAGLDIFEKRNGILKFHPLLDQTEEDCEKFIEKHNLPRHPLINRGYQSIGCTHCTVAGDLRNGRWNGHAKTECGLHI